MFLLSHKLLRDRNELVTFSLIISVPSSSLPSSSCSCDCFAAERADPPDSLSCSLLEASSFLTEQDYFFFGCLLLVIGASDTVETWVSVLVKVSVDMFSDPEIPSSP